ncbi:uncharacterized protein LOC135486244 isoform X2 [Lineus longissimus]|uniref:uncharacterized protein LOC135486244 isoform X2 n=1 Tax=Lineus longissimus TaxID=88925 RepID=UPI00315D9F81
MPAQEEAKSCEEFLTGTQFAEKHEFHDKKGRQLTVTPLIVDFRRLLTSSSSSICVIPGVSNTDLLHAVIGLYDVSLSEMTPDVLYATVCEKWARTLLLIRDVRDVLDEFEEKRNIKKESEDASDEMKSLTINDDENSKTDKSESPTAELTSEPKPSNDSEQKSFMAEPSKTETTGAAIESGDASKLDGAVENGKEDGEEEEEEDIYSPEECGPCTFAAVYSDTETEDEDEEEEEEEEEDFSKGMNAFIKAVEERRKERQSHTGPYKVEHVGIENRLVGCATMEKKYCKNYKVVHLTLIVVRKRFRKWGIGKYLLHQIKDPMVVGAYDAVVVHADNSATEFFGRYNFSDDIILNSRWSDLAEQFTNCTLMCYLPPFTGQGVLGNMTAAIDLVSMEEELKKWKEKSVEAYQAQITCATRLRNEIIQLRAVVNSQQGLIGKLAADNDSLTRDKFHIEKEYLTYRFEVAKSLLDSDVDIVSRQRQDDDDPETTKKLIKDLEKEVEAGKERKEQKKKGDKKKKSIDASAMNVIDRTRYMVYSNENKEPYDHMKDTQDFYRVTEEFKSTMRKDKTVQGNYEVKLVIRATLNVSVIERYQMRTSKLHDPKAKMRLYFCGSLEHPERLQDIIKHGFSERDFSNGEFGRGLHFSVYPSKAAQFSALGKLLTVEVAVGKVEAIEKKDHTRVSPSSGFDSVITPGRLSSSSKDDAELKSLNKEYIIFDVSQVLPLHLMEYSKTT